MNSWTVNFWTATVVAWLLDFGWLASIVLAAAGGLRWCFRDPAKRVALAWGTWLGLIALAIAIALPQWPRIALWPATVEGPAAVVLVERQYDLSTELLALPIETLAPPAAESSTSAATAASASWQDLVALAWLGIALLALSWIALGMLQTWLLVRRSAKAPPWIALELGRIVGKRRPPQVRTSQRLSSAAAVGAIAPRILLPEAAADESRRSHVRAALAHEWAHISRGDLWLLALERLLLPLLAWQPLFWWLRRNVRLDMELLADATAAGDEPVEYAEALVAWAKTGQNAPAGLAALSLWESPHTLSRRVTMLLDPKRTNPPAARRGWQILLSATVLALIGGLSLVSLRPHSAGGQEAQRPAESDATANRSPDEPITLIALQLCVLEADRQELEAVLPVERRWQADPESDLSLLAPDQWKARLKTLTSRPGTRILTRPQIQTLDGQMAYIDIGSLAPPLTPAEGSLAGSPESKPKLGLTMQLTPRQKKVDSERRVEIEFAVAQADLKEAGGEVVERKLSGKATVPVERQTLIIANRPRNPDLRPLVVAIDAYVTQRSADTVQEADPPARAENWQRVVKQLERQLADRQREAESQRDQSQALRKQVEDLKAEIAQLKKGAGQELRTYQLSYGRATDVAEVLRTLMEQMQSLTGDPQLAAIKITPNADKNVLLVQGSFKAHQALEAILEKLDAKPAKSTGGSSAAASRNPASLADALRSRADESRTGTETVDLLLSKGLITQHQAAQRQRAEESARVERETQVQLLKLDLQEAEIGLAAAEKDLQRVRILQGNSAISQEEVAKFEYQAQAAKIKVMRAKIMLDGAMRQLAPPATDPDKPATEPAPRLPPR